MLVLVCSAGFEYNIDAQRLNVNEADIIETQTEVFSYVEEDPCAYR